MAMTVAARIVGALVAAAVGVAACSGDTSSPFDERARDDGGDDGVDESVEVPTRLGARLTGDDPDAALEVSFVASPGAEGHRLDLDDGSDPVPVRREDCAGERCRVLLDRLSVGDATSLTVAAVTSEGRSPASEPVDVPRWPEPEGRPAPSPDRPVTLVIARAGEDGSLAIETESVPLGGAEARMAELESAPNVLGVEVNRTVADVQADEGDGDGDGTDEDDDEQGRSPSESDFSALLTWQREALDFDRLPEEPRGQGVTVAVIDGGVNTAHPALAGADIETTTVDGTRVVVPDEHGTGVTSLIVASTESPIPSMASGARIVNYDIKGGGEPDVADGARAIVAAVDDGADVINVSWVDSCNSLGPVPVHVNCASDALRSAVEYAERHGVVVVAGAGNDGDGAGCDHDDTLGPNEDHWPAAFPTVVAVGGTDRDGRVWGCSPDKDYIDVLAPASRLLVASNEYAEHYAVASGTSYAAPLVSGVIAVILAEQPDLTPAEIRDMLARATAENGRLVPGVVMAELGIVPPGSFEDGSTAQEVYPYTLELQLRPGHPITEAARAVEDSWMVPSLSASYEVVALGAAVWGSVEGDDVHLTIRGTLFADEDGSLTGYGIMDGIGPEASLGYRSRAGGSSSDGSADDSPSDDDSANAIRVGHQVACPRPADATLRPYIAFNWEVPATVGGELHRDEFRADIDLSLSLGQGASAGEAGELPGINVVHDDLDECEAVLQAEGDDWSTCRLPPCNTSHLCDELAGDACWSQVARARDDLIDVTETLYREIVALGPLTFDDDLRGFSDGVATVTSTTDQMRATLSIGT